MLPVICGSLWSVLLNLIFAFLWHCWVINVFLETSNNTSMSVGNIFAEILDCWIASFLHWKLKVNVLWHVHFLIKKSGTTFVGQIFPPAKNSLFEISPSQWGWQILHWKIRLRAKIQEGTEFCLSNHLRYYQYLQVGQKCSDPSHKKRTIQNYTEKESNNAHLIIKRSAIDLTNCTASEIGNKSLIFCFDL